MTRMRYRFFLSAFFLAASLAGASTAFAATSTQAASPAAGASAVTTVPIDTEQSSNTNQDAGKGSTVNGTYESAIVLSAQNVSQQTADGAQQLKDYTVEFVSGPLKGKQRVLSSDVSTNPYGLIPVPGDKVIVFLQPDPQGGEPNAYLESYDRRGAIYWLIALFVGMMVLLAGRQGLKIAFSIFLSILLIAVVLIPSFLNGINPIPVTLFLVAVLAAVSSALSVGWNRKSVVTIIGTVGGVLVAYIVAHIFAGWAHLSGMSTEDDRLFFDNNPMLDARGLLFSGIAIAAMGVVMDVAVSIASGVMEVRQANTRLGFKDLFRSGMVVGRDHMGALANTLVFAYVGGSLSTLLLYTQYGGSWAKFLNFDSITDEIIRSLAGTIGLIFTVPITALLAAWFALRIKSAKDIVHSAEGWHKDHFHG